MNGKYFKVLLGVALAGLVLGTWGMFNLFVYGKEATALGSYVPWGLWVAVYLFFLGLTAGAFLITILTYVFRIKVFAPIGPLSAFTVLVALICEILIIAFDLGHMFRAYRFLITPSFTSMITWMVIFTIAMIVIYLLECYFLLRENLVAWSQDEGRPGRGLYRFLAFGRTTFTDADREADHRWVRVLSLISLPVGLIFYGVNGAIFAVILDRPFWNSAITPFNFILTALLSGGALITLLTYVFRIDDELIHRLGHVVRLLLAVFLLVEVFQFFVGYLSGTAGAVASLNLILFGPYWWVFWIFHVVIGSAIPLILFYTRLDDAKAVAWACFLILVTFIAVRLNFLIPNLATYKLEGLEAAFNHPRLRTDYFPNLTEWLVSLWIVSLGILTFLLGTRWLPVIAAGKGEEEHV